jgi:hypothetical protein
MTPAPRRLLRYAPLVLSLLLTGCIVFTCRI